MWSALDREELELSNHYSKKIRRNVAVYKLDGKWRVEGMQSCFGMEPIIKDAKTHRAAAQSWVREWLFRERTTDIHSIKDKCRRPKEI